MPLRPLFASARCSASQSPTPIARGAEGAGQLSVVAATNRPNIIDPALRRPGRLDLEVAVPVPDACARLAILRLHAALLPLAADVNLTAVAAACVGYSGADLGAVCREAAISAISAEAEGLMEGLLAGDGSEPPDNGGLGGACATSVRTTARNNPASPKSGEDVVNMLAGLSIMPGEETAHLRMAEPCHMKGDGQISMADMEEAMRRVAPSITRGAHVELPPGEGLRCFYFR